MRGACSKPGIACTGQAPVGLPQQRDRRVGPSEFGQILFISVIDDDDFGCRTRLKQSAFDRLSRGIVAGESKE